MSHTSPMQSLKCMCELSHVGVTMLIPSSNKTKQLLTITVSTQSVKTKHVVVAPYIL